VPDFRCERGGGSGAISSLVDTRILQPGGALLGRVDELLIDLRSGRVTHIVAKCPDGGRRVIPWHLVECRGQLFRLRTALAPLAAGPGVRGVEQ
jgi:sporulation protein YlmC with PRC-barrel domain